MHRYRFATAQAPILELERAEILYDGMLREPRLLHPEGVAIGPDGWIWCSSEMGQLLRIPPDGSQLEEVATTGGFTLGIAFEADIALYACDVWNSAVFRLELASRRLARFTQPGIKVPNYPVVDTKRRRLLVSDSYAMDESGPGVWSYPLDGGAGFLWYNQPMELANGMALGPDGDSLYVVETWARRVTRIAFLRDGRPGAVEPFVEDLPGLPDGIAFDGAGDLFVGCYEPSRVLRVSDGGRRTEVYIEDPTSHRLSHPTNIAFDGASLYTANLGRWHITRIASDTGAEPVVKGTYA